MGVSRGALISTLLGSFLLGLVLVWYYEPAGLTTRSKDLLAIPQHETHLQDLRHLYLATMRASLTGSLLQTPSVRAILGNQSLIQVPFSSGTRHNGSDWPLYGLTMVGHMRLQNIQDVWTHVLTAKVEGDYAECGVWRGGAAIFSRAVLMAYRDTSRIVHVVDSFAGLPKATSAEDIDDWSATPFLSVSLLEVQSAFDRAGLLDAQVQFHKGYFRYALPPLRSQLLAQGRKLAILRMDGDMYESTMDQLFLLYDLISVGGFVIIDDYFIVECKRAVHQFLAMHAAFNATHIKNVDGVGAYFQKTIDFPVNMTWYLRYNSSRGLEQR